MSELFGYNTDLRSMTGGIGLYEYEFSRYEQYSWRHPEEGSRGQSSQGLTNWMYNLWIPEDRFADMLGLYRIPGGFQQQRSSFERCLSCLF